MSRQSLFLPSLILATVAIAVPARADVRRPLSFEPGTRQAGPGAQFVARADGFSLLLSAREVVMKRGMDVVRMRFDGSAGAELTPLELQRGVSNYLLGNDPRQWRTGVPTYGRVQYRHLYPGIDLVFYGNDRELEFDLVVAPGADPGRIRMTLEGARFRIVDGDLVGRGHGGEFRFRKPVIYQPDGVSKRAVRGRFRLDGATVTYDVDPYDRSKVLVIDPVIVYSTLLGGTSGDNASHNGIAVDAAGNAYVTGYTESTDFPTTAGAYWTAKSTQQKTAFVTKIAPDGATVLYSTYLGGTLDRSGVREDSGRSIAVDAAGHAYVVGKIYTSNFPSTPGTITRSNPGIFLTKLDGSGQLVYSATWAGMGDEPTGVALDSQNNVYITGKTLGLDDVVGPGAFQTQCRCFQSAFTRWDAFVVKLTPSASAVVYGTYIGGWSSDESTAIAVDSAGQASVIGFTGSDQSTFPLVNAVQDTFLGNATDLFVTKLNATGTGAIFSTFLGGHGDENRPGFTSTLGGGIAIDAAGDIYLTGHTTSTDFPTTPGAPYGYAPTSFANPFVTKLTGFGQIIYSTYLPGGYANGVAVDSAGRAFVTGGTFNPNFAVTPDAIQPALASMSDDAFLTVLDASGTAFVFSTYFGGAGQDLASGIALGPNGSVYMIGQTEGANPVFVTTPGAFQTTGSGQGSDVWVARVAFAPPPPPPDTTAPTIASVKADPSILWPPNNKLVPVAVSASATDDSGGDVVCAIASISGDQGTQTSDWSITGPLTAMLRASKGLKAAPRTYTITVGCVDAAGNTATSTVTVVVPHSK